MHRKAEEESHSGVLWATTRTQRGAAWAAHTSSDFGCSALSTRGSVPVTMTGSLRRLQELAACCMQRLAPCSRATKEAHLMAARQSAINTAHCSLKITERCTMKLAVVATPWAMTNAMI
jgi:hypothetical protein